MQKLNREFNHWYMLQQHKYSIIKNFKETKKELINAVLLSDHQKHLTTLVNVVYK